ncbi:hypothetical protein [Haloimpatiens lingqiaonensis]|uniref:hypothetical protein n=1 Tax=Haloimpatiens lingqiaonensis TaxID=1380675 RepID=UPI0010FF079B|nr:hypothetical protein [Haloimpatiens lingqiaonensis]
MYKVNFLPREYKEKNRNEIFNKIIIIFTIINIMMIINALFYKEKVQKISKEIKICEENMDKYNYSSKNISKYSNEDDSKNNSKDSIKYNSNDKASIESINNFIDLYNFSKSSISFNSINVNEKEIQFNANASGISSYINYLEKMEKENKYQIKDFSNSKKEENIGFSVKMEVK